MSDSTAVIGRGPGGARPLEITVPSADGPAHGHHAPWYSRCARCGAPLRVLAVITDPRVVAAIVAHLEARAARAPPPLRH